MKKIIDVADCLGIYEDMPNKEQVINYSFALTNTTPVVKYSGHIDEIEIEKIFNKLYLD
jgi:hypothetical protein